MSESPFETPGAPSASSEGAPQGAQSKARIIVPAIAAALIVAGFVWKMLIGSAPAGGEAVASDYAWLLPVAIGAALFFFGSRRRNR